MIGSHANVCHVDAGALDWAVAKWQVRNFIDIGCGLGAMVQLAKARSLEAIGVDGDSSVAGIYHHDFRVAPFGAEASFDLGWSVEFVEHIEEKFIGNFMPLFARCRRVIMTHALPPNNPPGHVNCRVADYWLGVFAAYEFEYEAELTLELRANSTMDREFLRSTGKVFTRRRAGVA